MEPKEYEEYEIKNGEVCYGGDTNEKKFWLEHHCDDWIIGNIVDAEIFARDLLKTIQEVVELKTSELLSEKMDSQAEELNAEQ